jgi:hypothetical protein
MSQRALLGQAMGAAQLPDMIDPKINVMCRLPTDSPTKGLALWQKDMDT